eukprot:g7104.t1
MSSDGFLQEVTVIPDAEARILPADTLEEGFVGRLKWYSSMAGPSTQYLVVKPFADDLFLYDSRKDVAQQQYRTRIPVREVVTAVHQSKAEAGADGRRFDIVCHQKLVRLVAESPDQARRWVRSILDAVTNRHRSQRAHERSKQRDGGATAAAAAAAPTTPVLSAEAPGAASRLGAASEPPRGRARANTTAGFAGPRDRPERAAGPEAGPEPMSPSSPAGAGPSKDWRPEQPGSWRARRRRGSATASGGALEAAAAAASAAAAVSEADGETNRSQIMRTLVGLPQVMAAIKRVGIAQFQAVYDTDGDQDISTTLTILQLSVS